jgi:hypothetical protein
VQLTDAKNTRPAYLVSILTLLVLLVGSLVWYKQRMLFVDPCWITYQNINTGHLNIAEHRYGAVITQIVPLIGSKLNLSLNTILIAYSVSFYLFYLAVALIVGYCYRQYWLVILMACYFTFFVSDVYFWPNNEVHQGVAWMILFIGTFLHYSRKERFNIPVVLLLLVLAFLAVFSHFIVIIPLSFLWLYYILENRKHFNRKAIIATVVCSLCIAVLFAVKYKIGTTNSWYDAGKLEPIKKMGLDTIMASFSSGHAKTIFPLFFSSYWIIIPVFIAGIISLILAKKYLQLILVMAYTIGYFSLLCLTYPDAFGRELLFYMESEWMALAIIIATPFVLQVLPQLNGKTMAVLFAAIFIIRLGYIGNAYQLFNRRLTTVERITDNLHKQHIDKATFLIGKSHSDELFVYNWGLPIESIMISELKHYSPRVTFKVVTDSLSIRYTPGRDSFFSCFNLVPVKEQDKRYFSLDPLTVYLHFTEAHLDRLIKK